MARLCLWSWMWREIEWKAAVRGQRSKVRSQEGSGQQAESGGVVELVGFAGAE